MARDVAPAFRLALRPSSAFSERDGGQGKSIIFPVSLSKNRLGGLPRQRGRCFHRASRGLPLIAFPGRGSNAVGSLGRGTFRRGALSAFRGSSKRELSADSKILRAGTRPIRKSLTRILETTKQHLHRDVQGAVLCLKYFRGSFASRTKPTPGNSRAARSRASVSLTR